MPGRPGFAANGAWSCLLMSAAASPANGARRPAALPGDAGAAATRDGSGRVGTSAGAHNRNRPYEFRPRSTMKYEVLRFDDISLGIHEAARKGVIETMKLNHLTTLLAILATMLFAACGE